MSRYILIDNYSGYIFADSADLNGRIFDGTPTQFAEAFDHSINEYGRSYEMLHHNPRTTETGYHVYCAVAAGSEVVPVIEDGQNQEMIQTVEQQCRYVGFIRCLSTSAE